MSNEGNGGGGEEKRGMCGKKGMREEGNEKKGMREGGKGGMSESGKERRGDKGARERRSKGRSG